MRTIVRTMPLTLGMVMLGTVLAPRASAQCAFFEGPKASAFEPRGSGQSQPALRPVSSLPVSDSGDSDERGIVGFWKVTFVAEGNPDIPDGTVIDFGYAQWHGDRTEIMNSSRPPATGNFCLGVWKGVGPSRYKLNHFALSSDLSGNMIGPANIRENVTLGHSENTYTGTFTIDQFDLSGNLLVHIAGRVAATRITVDTPANAVTS